MPAYTLKLVIAGNTEVGKTRLCNSLTNTQSKSCYEATVGCRIIEYDTNINGISVDNQHSEQFEVTLEFWDISGDLQYKNCWHAMRHNSIGVIIVFDSSKMEESDIRMWYNAFVHKTIRSKQCLILSMNNDTPQFTQGTPVSYDACNRHHIIPLNRSKVEENKLRKVRI
eukprot:140107_1